MNTNSKSEYEKMYQAEHCETTLEYSADDHKGEF